MWATGLGTNAPLKLRALFEEIVDGRQLVRPRELVFYVDSYVDKGDKPVEIRSITRSWLFTTGEMWMICDAGLTEGLAAFGRVVTPLLRMGFFNEVNLVKGNLVSLVVVETFSDPLDGDVGRSIEPVRAIREGKLPLRADRLVYGMGVRVYRDIHVPREAFSRVSEARPASHDVDGVAGGLVPSERRLVILAICVNGEPRELVQQDIPIVGTQCMFSPPAPTFQQLQALQDRRCVEPSPRN